MSIQYTNQIHPAMEAMAKALGIDTNGLIELEVRFRVGETTKVRIERTVLNHEAEAMVTKLEEFYSIDGQAKHIGGRILSGQTYLI